MNRFITLIFACMFTLWTIRLYYKLYDKKIRRYILNIGLLIIFWMLIRIIKGLTILPFCERICWYLYYLPLIYIPTLYYICSLSLLGKISKLKKYIIYTFSFILFILVLTNDFHEFVFKFNQGILFYDNYTHYIGYYIISIWIFYLFSKSLIYLGIYRMKIKKDFKVFLPFIVIIIGIVYTVLYIKNTPYVRNINMSIFNSTLICIGIELVFYLNLIPNNKKYINKFSSSNLDMAITSFDGKTIYNTKVFKVPYFILNDIKNNNVKNTYKKGYILYDVKKNKDSYVILKKDLSSISKLEKEIKMQRKNLLSQQESLKIEEKTKKELYEVSIRKKVIDKVEISLAKKKMEAKKILSKKNITDFDLEKLKKIIIYSKKKSMLVISSLNKDIYNEKDITLILNELFNSMNVKGYVSINDKLTIDGNALINIYDILTFFVDNYYKNSIMVFIFKDKNIKIKIVIDSLKFNKSKFDFDISNIVVKKYSEDSEILITMKENL